MKRASKVACSLVLTAVMSAGANLSISHAAVAVVNEPAIVKAVPPSYPRAAERRSIEGSVQVSIDVADDGSVTAVTVMQADPPGIFDTAAIKAVERWKFESGKPSQGVLKTIRFKLEG